MKRPAIIALVGGGLFVALLLGIILFTSGGGASASKSNAAGGPNAATQVSAAPDAATLTSAEAEAWAEARAANTAPAYRVYLAAYPQGAFADEAQEALDRIGEERAVKQQRATTRPPVQTAAAPAPARPSRASIAAACQDYVDRTLSRPSKVGRTVGGAAGGCAVGMLAGGDDGRNCAVGAVAGAATGAITAENRERRRREEVDRCIANGGPPG
jgi:hypothetical protein